MTVILKCATCGVVSDVVTTHPEPMYDAERTCPKCADSNVCVVGEYDETLPDGYDGFGAQLPDSYWQ